MCSVFIVFAKWIVNNFGNTVDSIFQFFSQEGVQKGEDVQEESSEL